MKRVMLVVALLLTSATIAGTPARADSEGGGGRLISNPDAVVHGKTYTEWASDYYTWMQEIPAGKNPLDHPSSPRNCERQRGNVVFVGSNGADCDVPSGAKIAFSAQFFECSTAEGNGKTWRALRRCANQLYDEFLGPDSIHVTLWIDGKLVHHPRAWELVTPGEIVDLPEHNIWGVDDGPTKSVTKGAFYVLKPLSDGTHTIHAHVTEAGDGPLFDIDFVFNVG